MKTHKQSCEVSKRGRQNFPRTIITMLSQFVVHLPLSFFATLGVTKIPLIFIAVLVSSKIQMDSHGEISKDNGVRFC